MTDDELKREAMQAKLIEAKSIAAESEAARLGAVKMANGLREENDRLRQRLSECEELLEQARTEASVLRDEHDATVDRLSEELAVYEARHGDDQAEIAGLREQLADTETAYQTTSRIAYRLREQLAARRDDLAEALVAAAANAGAPVCLIVQRNQWWELTGYRTHPGDKIVGCTGVPPFYEAAAAIRAAIAPKPPTPHEVAEAWHRISNCINGISVEDRATMRAAVEAFVGKDGEE